MALAAAGVRVAADVPAADGARAVAHVAADAHQVGRHGDPPAIPKAAGDRQVSKSRRAARVEAVAESVRRVEKDRIVRKELGRGADLDRKAIDARKAKNDRRATRRRKEEGGRKDPRAARVQGAE
mmetsp:Transcript_69592/g.110302  ORF Transcript_69592/g.110302 Transcript_69592/m.110302 type:complete len:125 (+) Transcript_69592:3-377(+)